MESLFIVIGGLYGNSKAILIKYTIKKLISSTMAKVLICSNFSGLNNLHITAHTANNKVGIKSGCIRKLSIKLPLKNSKPDRVSPHAGQGKPTSIIVGAVYPKKVLASMI